MPIAFKFILNLFFYIVYSFMGIFIGNLFYGGLLFYLGKNIPGTGDSIHIQIAVASCIFVLLITLALRKYFYIELDRKKN